MSRYFRSPLAGGVTEDGRKIRFNIDAKKWLAMLPKDAQGNIIVNHGPSTPAGGSAAGAPSATPSSTPSSAPGQPIAQPSDPPQFVGSRQPWKKWALWGAAGVGAFALVWLLTKPTPRRTP